MLAHSQLCLIFLLIALPQNTPVSDVTTTWSLDPAGRVASCGAVQYSYDHPLGVMTGKSYGGVALNYNYDAKCSLIVDGAPAGTQTFPATNGQYQTVTLNVDPANTLELLMQDTCPRPNKIDK